MSTSPQYAFVTLVTSDHYLPGALVVAAALHDVHPSPPMYPEEFDPSDFHRVCLVTPETVNVSTVKQLRKAFDVVIGVEVIEADTQEGLELLGRPDLMTVLTKLHVFRLTAYRKIIFLDADILTLRPVSHLFSITASFAAVPDVGWPDVFNSGFFLLEPSEEKFKEVMALVKSKGSWDGGDQGILNEWIGPNWDRLSFTYNTTPTAVYTYAPAYKRFGSQISNIHFIGPNKPWTQNSFRSTSSFSNSSASSTPSAGGLGPSYDYPALVDRWFSVYDSHYQPLAEDLPMREGTDLLGSTIEPLAQRYESAWDSDIRPSLGAETSGGPSPLGLDELRRLAIEGTGKVEVQGKEGVYQSLPLEGRVDLMRPPKLVIQAGPSAVGENMKSPPQAVRIVVPDSPHTPVRQFEVMTTLPTPGPNEIPPAPSFRGQSLPPETPTYAQPRGTTDDSPHRSSLHASHAIGQFPSPISPSRSPSRSPSSHLSPPLLLWDPAVEAPPTDAPPVSSFPEDTYFPNQWDTPASTSREVDDTDGFFRLQPLPPIPEMLVKGGHYKAVIGEKPVQQEQGDDHYSQSNFHHPHDDRQDQEHRVLEQHQDEQHVHQEQQRPSAERHEESRHPEHQHYHQEHQDHHHSRQTQPQPSYPQPDRSKVGAVFPWEQKPRPAPERYFPRTDSPPPDHSFIQPRPLPGGDADIHPRTTRVFPSGSVPVQGFPRTTTYDNVWDAVPSIQRYAARLVRPQSMTSPVSAESGSGRRSRKNSSVTPTADEYRRWQDLVEVSSRDADDEDEDGDDEDEPSPFIRGVDPDKGGGRLSVSPSLTQKTYKTRGMQTPMQVYKHQSVQVPLDNEVVSLQPVSRTPARKEQTLPKDTKSKTGRDRSSSTASLAKQRIQPQPASERSPILSPQMPALSPLTTESQGILTASNAASLSPSSSLLGPRSPEDAPVVYRPRRPQRTFDPARGVDVFKRGSEEVLARFLKMESWEEESKT